MKKILFVILCLTLCLAVFAACTEEPGEEQSGSGTEAQIGTGDVGTEDNSEDNSTEDNTGDAAACEHTGGTATCTAKATCEKCGEAYGALAAHTFDKETAEDKYIATDATCIAKATYYKSCSVCGEKGTETFESGELLPHEYSGGIVWTASEGIYTAADACATEGCTVSKPSAKITVSKTEGVDAIEQIEDEAEFKFKLTPADGYYTVSVKVGETALEADADGVYSVPVKDSEIAIVMSDMYTVKFVNYDDSVIKEETLKYGTTVTPPVASREPTATTGYEFAGWTPAVANVTGDAVYKATYTEVPLADKWTITWIIDGAEQKKYLDNGTVPTPPEAVKAADAQYTYTFKGWTPEIVAATADATYTAVFDKTLNEYTVTFMAEDGETVLQSGKVAYGTVPVYEGEDIPAFKWSDFRYDVFGWDKEVIAVDGDVTYTVTYTPSYEYQMFAMTGETVSNTAPNRGNDQEGLPNFTIANINQENTEKYRVTLVSTEAAANVDYREHESIVFSFSVNYDGIKFSAVDGTEFLTSIKNLTYRMAVDKDGKVYINGILLDGITMTDGVIAFNVTRNSDTDTFAYLALSGIAYDVEMKSEFMSQLKDVYEGAGVNGTKNVVPAENADKIAMGITQFTTFTAGGWQEQPLTDFDLTPYSTVKFYAQRLSGGSIKVGTLTFYCDPNVTEFKFVKNGEGYDMYVAGEKQDLGDTVLTNLNQIKFNIGGAGQEFRYSDVIVDAESYIAPAVLTPVSGSIYSAATLESAPASTPNLEDKTGLEIYSYTSSGWANASFADIDLMQYNEVKLYVMSLTNNGSIKQDCDGGDSGTIAYLSDSAWTEIHLVKNDEGTGFDIYVNGVAKSMTFYTDNKKETETPLTNLKQLTLNQNSEQQFLISNLYTYTAE